MTDARALALRQSRFIAQYMRIIRRWAQIAIKAERQLMQRAHRQEAAAFTHLYVIAASAISIIGGVLAYIMLVESEIE